MPQVRHPLSPPPGALRSGRIRLGPASQRPPPTAVPPRKKKQTRRGRRPKNRPPKAEPPPGDSTTQNAAAAAERPDSARCLMCGLMKEEERSSSSSSASQHPHDDASNAIISEGDPSSTCPLCRRPLTALTEPAYRLDECGSVTRSRAISMACPHPITRAFLEQTYEESLQHCDRHGTPRQPTDLVGGPVYSIAKVLVWPPLTMADVWDPRPMPRMIRRETSAEEPDPQKRWFVMEC